MSITFIRANKAKSGGAETYLSRLTHELGNRGVSYQFVHSSLPKILPSWIRALVFNFWVCRQKKDNLYFSLERITCPDIYRAGDGVHKVFLTKVNKSKLNPLHIVYQYLEKKCFQRAKHIIANSQMVKDEIIASYHIDNTKISVIYNGINLSRKGNAKSIQEEFALGDERILLYVGSGFKRKGVEEFLHLVAKLHTLHIKAFIVGKEKRISRYKKLAQSLGIENIVIFTGPRSDVEDFYAVSDVFILPTLYEPCSNVVFEAMNYHTAVFTTSSNGASELLESEYIMPTPDNDISQQIDELFAHPEQLQQVAQRNYAAVQHYSIEENATQTLAVIECVMNVSQKAT